MTSLIFLAVIIAILVLLVQLIYRLFQMKSIILTIRNMGIIIGCYALLWVLFYFFSSYESVPAGTDICFDDWCATITAFEKSNTLGRENHLNSANGLDIILYIKMSNHARGIAQKPSGPRVHIIDDKGHSWSFSKEGQHALEERFGKQFPLDSRLELHQSLETRLVFEVPSDSKDLKAIIEEGPLITRLLLPENKKVFSLE